MKIYAYLGAAVLAGVLILGVYHAGGAGCRENASQAALEAKDRETRLLYDLETAKQTREVIYRDKIKIVDRVVDSCADANIPAPVLLLLPGGGQAK